MDQLLLLFPQPVKKVYCRMHHDFPSHDVESHVMTVVEFEDGATGVCDMSSMAAAPKPRFYACGTEAAFVKYGVDPQEKAMIAGDIDAAQEEEGRYGRLYDGKTDQAVATVPGRWRNYYENIADVLTGKAEPLVKLDEMQRLMALFDAVFESARSGKCVTPHECLSGK